MVFKRSQRALSLVLSLIMLFALSSVFCFERAGAVADGEWTYDIEPEGANITGYIGTSPVVNVPSKLGDQKVYKVSSLSNNKFKDSITSITFSNGITQLGDSVCKGYSALEKVALPDTLTSIGKDAFASCISLAGITVPNAVTYIGDNAFGGCTSLISATLNCRMTSVPMKLFAGDKKLTTVTIPTYTTEICDNAFDGCVSLTSITLPSSVKTIGTNAFSHCSSLTSVTLSSELKTIGQLAFYDCSSLTSIFIPNKVKTINDEAFSGCTSLRTAYICPSVQVMKSNVFNSCTSLESIIFGGQNYGFNEYSSTSIASTVYYPAKYVVSWADYYAPKVKSYQAPSSITLTGNTTVDVGSTVVLNISVNGDFKDAYVVTSSNPTVATVTPEGKLLARSTGITTITVTAVSGVTKTAEISVKPAAPTNIKAVSKTTTSADISWKAGYNVTGYNIYRSTSKNGTYKKVGNTTGTTYTDKGLTKGKTYYYKVASYVNSDGKQVISSYSSVVSVKAAAPAPSTITAKKAKSGVAKITWGKSNGASGYEVYMATSSSGKYTKIATVSKPTTLSCTKTGLKAGKTYYFKVRSYTTVSGKKVYSDYTKVVKVKV